MEFEFHEIVIVHYFEYLKIFVFLEKTHDFLEFLCAEGRPLPSVIARASASPTECLGDSPERPSADVMMRTAGSYIPGLAR